MNERKIKISSERIDDIPLILEWLKQMQIAKYIDQKLKKPHGNYQGMSYGQLSVLLLTYIITQSDHRLCAVEGWVKAHRQIWELSTGWSIGDKDASDDRLARLVEELGKQSQARQKIEIKLGQHLIHAYELPTEIARTDTTSFSVNHQDSESSSNLLRYGYSKDKRPDLLQYRQLLATLDPMGMPLVSATLEGNGADDPLYFPVWQKIVKVIGHKKLLFIADCQAGSIIKEETQLETRYLGRGRPSKNSQQEQVTRIRLQLHIEQINDAIEEAEILAGWRLYVTNAPGTKLTLPQAVMYYRDEWLLERGFHRFRRGSLPALPIYFQNPDRITGLMFWLNIALRVFTLMEFVVRQALVQTQQSLAGIYDGNPKRKTERPSAEQILKAFCHITLYFLPDSNIFITPLNELQNKILSLMKMSQSLYLLDSKLCKT